MMYPKARWFQLIAVLLGFTSCTKSHTDVLRVLSFRDRQSTVLKASFAEFEKKHGIKIQFDDIPAESVAIKMMTDLAAGGTYDVYALDEPFLPQFSSSLVPVSQWPGDFSAEEIKLFERKAIEAAQVDQILMGLPVNGNVYQYIYRKDLFSDLKEKEEFLKMYHRELLPPTSLKEMVDLAKFFYRPPKLYGFAPFTKLSEGTTVEMLWLLAGFGYTPGDKSISPEIVSNALSLYMELLKTAPKAAKSWHHSERMSAYAKGKIAQMMTWNSFFFDLEDENKSLVGGLTGYTRSPGQGSTSLAGSWIAGIRKGTAHLEAASQFIKWWTSRETSERLVPIGLSSPRADILTSSILGVKFPWLSATHLNFESAFLRPRSTDYRAVSNDLSKTFTRWVAGQISQAEASSLLFDGLLQMNKLASPKNEKVEEKNK